MHTIDSKLALNSKHVFFEHSSRVSILNEIQLIKKPKITILEFGINLFSLEFFLLNNRHYRTIDVTIIVNTPEDKEIVLGILDNKFKHQVLLDSEITELENNIYDYGFLNQDVGKFEDNLEYCISKVANLSIVLDKTFLNLDKYRNMRSKLSKLQIATVFDLPTEFSKKNKSKDYIFINILCNGSPKTTDIISPLYGNIYGQDQNLITSKFPNWVLYCDTDFLETYNTYIKLDSRLKAYHDRDISSDFINQDSGIPVIGLKSENNFISADVLTGKGVLNYLNLNCYYCDPRLATFVVKTKPHGSLVDRSLTIIHGDTIRLELLVKDEYQLFLKKSQNYDLKNRFLHETLIHYIPVKRP